MKSSRFFTNSFSLPKITGLVFSLLIMAALLTNFFETKPQDKNVDNFQTGQTSSPNLKGKILYSDANSIYLYDLTSHSIKKVVDNFSNESNVRWYFTNGYIFYIKNNTIVRQDPTKENSTKILTIKPQDCQNKIGPFEGCFIIDIFPSPDGQKVAFMLYTGPENEGMGTLDDEHLLKVVDLSKPDSFVTIKESKDTIGYPGQITWFNNNHFLYIGGKQIFDTTTNKLTNLTKLNSDQIYPSYLGDNYLWFDSQGIKAKDRDIFDIYRPNLINSSLSKVGRDKTIPFINFPIIGRDFKEISRVIAIDKNTDFLIEITTGNGKKDIYFTDSSGTFKKINPNNSDSYILLDYLSSRRQVLATRIQEERGYHRRVISTQLVLLNVDNYSEFVSDIDNDSSNKFYEKTLISPSPLIFTDYKYAISPDEKYLVLSQDKDNSDNCLYVSIDDQSQMPSDISFGQTFYWLEDQI